MLAVEKPFLTYYSETGVLSKTKRKSISQPAMKQHGYRQHHNKPHNLLNGTTLRQHSSVGELRRRSNVPIIRFTTANDDDDGILDNEDMHFHQLRKRHDRAKSLAVEALPTSQRRRGSMFVRRKGGIKGYRNQNRRKSVQLNAEFLNSHEKELLREAMLYVDDDPITINWPPGYVSVVLFSFSELIFLTFSTAPCTNCIGLKNNSVLN